MTKSERQRQSANEIKAKQVIKYKKLTVSNVRGSWRLGAVHLFVAFGLGLRVSVTRVCGEKPFDASARTNLCIVSSAQADRQADRQTDRVRAASAMETIAAGVTETATADG